MGKRAQLVVGVGSALVLLGAVVGVLVWSGIGGSSGSDDSVASACSGLEASEAVGSVPDLMRDGIDGRSVEGVSIAVDRLRDASEWLTSAESAADALESWASAPENLDNLEEVAERFAALEEEVAAQCGPS